MKGYNEKQKMRRRQGYDEKEKMKRLKDEESNKRGSLKG